MGLTFGYMLERIKEGRLKEKSADVLKNEIEVLCKDIKEDFKLVESAKEGEKPEGILEEKIYLGAYLLSPSMYGIDAYDSYLGKIYLFQSNTQKAIMSFYIIIKKIIRDLGSIQATLENKDVPDQLIKDLYAKQYKLRKKALEKAELCSKELGKGRKQDMSKYKRNILLIFGYLLIIWILFVPYRGEIYHLVEVKKYPEDWPSPSSSEPQNTAIQDAWEDLPTVQIVGHKKIIRESLDKNEFKLLPLYVANVVNHRNFIKWKKQLEEELYNHVYKEKKITIEQLFHLQEEFIKKYNGEFRYDKLRFDFFLTELTIILLVGGCAYILFCVVLRKDEKKGEK